MTPCNAKKNEPVPYFTSGALAGQLDSPMSSGISARVQKLVIGPSGNRCARPQCRIELASEPNPASFRTVLGVIAHIKGEKPGSARYDSAQPDHERNDALNLIYICGTCHTLIDGDSLTYTVEILRKMKADHEAWVQQSLLEAVGTVTFAELESVCMGIVGTPMDPNISFSITPLLHKMDKNGLTSSIQQQLAAGLAIQPKVRDYISSVARRDAAFPGRLRHGFLLQYEKFISQGYAGDALFYTLADYAMSNSSANPPNVARRTAGLAVLCHLFAICEVFDP